ncbi:MAG TPA: nucleotide pyrophosphohydrolase [Patescibacteria group bacterium]|nr:nucleotide pyrophosphohydrolase [Patescibacteria group bacterium]
MRDDKTTIQELKDLVIKFAKDRHWEKHHVPKNLAMGIAIEAAELMEHYQWEREGDPDPEEVADELADIIFNALNFAYVTNIDVASAFMHKYEKIVKKYPVDIFNEKNDTLKDYRRIKKQYRQGKK